MNGRYDHRSYEAIKGIALLNRKRIGLQRDLNRLNLMNCYILGSIIQPKVEDATLFYSSNLQRVSLEVSYWRSGYTAHNIPSEYVF